MKPNICSLIDLTQSENMLEVPEIRVWCHPHLIEKDEEDYYITFDTFEDALAFIVGHDEAEKKPLIAFRGYEINILEIEKHKEEKKNANDNNKTG